MLLVERVDESHVHALLLPFRLHRYEPDLNSEPGQTLVVHRGIKGVVIMEISGAEHVVVDDLELNRGFRMLQVTSIFIVEEVLVLGLGGVEVVAVNDPVSLDAVCMEHSVTEDRFKRLHVHEELVVALLGPAFLFLFKLDLGDFVSVQAFTFRFAILAQILCGHLNVYVAVIIFVHQDVEVANLAHHDLFLANAVDGDYLLEVDLISLAVDLGFVHE